MCDHTLYKTYISIAFLSVLTSIIMVLTSQLLRFGFDYPSHAIPALLSVSLFCFSFPLFLRKITNSDNYTFHVLISIIILIFISFLSRIFNYGLWPIVFCIGFISTLYLFSEYKKFHSFFEVFFALIVTIIISPFFANLAYGRYSKLMTTTKEQLIFDISGQIDYFFHLAITSMINTYGIPSAGLHGTPYVHYHWGSHWFFSLMSDFTNLNIMEVYYYFPCFLIPLMCCSLLFLSFIISTIKGAKNIQPVAFFVAYLLLPVIIVGPLIYFFNIPVLIYDRSGSEPIFISSIIFIMLLSFCVSEMMDDKQSDFSSIAFLLKILVFILFVIFLGILHIITMILFVALSIYIFGRLKLYLNWKNFVYIIFIVLSFLFSYALVLRPEAVSNFELFYILKYLIRDFKEGLYVVIFFESVFYFLILRHFFVSRSYSKYFTNLPFTIDIEIIVVLIVCALVPLILIKSDDNIYFYFLSVPKRLAFVLLLSTIPFIITYRKSMSAYCVAVLFIGALVFISVQNSYNAGIDLLRYNISFRRSILKLDNIQENFTIFQYYTINEYMNCIKKMKNYQIINRLDGFSKLPRSLKKGLLVEIPATNHYYWKLADEISAPFILPAITGIAHYNGLLYKASISKKINYYGFWSYRDVLNTSQGKLDEFKNENVKILGFSKLLILNQDP